MTASWHNIRPEYNNNKLKISKDKGKTFETITFPAGIFDYEDINEFIHKKNWKIGNEYEINVLFDLTTFRVFIQLDENYQIDFANSGEFNVLLEFKKDLLKSSGYGKKTFLTFQIVLIIFMEEVLF